MARISAYKNLYIHNQLEQSLSRGDSPKVSEPILSRWGGPEFKRESTTSQGCIDQSSSMVNQSPNRGELPEYHLDHLSIMYLTWRNSGLPK